MRSSLLALLVACSSHSGEPKKPNGSSSPLVDGGGVAVAPRPSERECTDLFTHAIELQVADIKQTKPAQVPTADELARVQTELRDQFLTTCRASTLDGYRCAMTATTLADLATCQPTPSSSTSNSSVAPGGITPAAPLSP